MPLLQLSKKESRLGSKTFKVGMIPTMVAGQAYYRMAGFCWKMRQRPHVEAVCTPFAFDHLEQNPWETDYLTQPEVVRKHLEYICEKSDVVVWQTLHYQYTLDLFESLRLKYQKPFLVETDDCLYDIPAGNAAFNDWRPGSTPRNVSLSQIRQADCLIVSTPYLADMYKDMNPNIRVVPNSMDLDIYKDIRIKKHDRVRIGWIGGATHNDDLLMVADAIQEVLARYREAWFYCVHGVPNEFKTWPKTYWTRRWAPINLYPRFMASFKFDIGIAPLQDNNFNRGKSNLRWLEYSALKIPTVASPLPDFKRSIIAGHDGLIARDKNEWVEALSQLIEHADKRVQMGRNAFETVRRRFNMQKTSRDYLRILQEVATW